MKKKWGTDGAPCSAMSVLNPAMRAKHRLLRPSEPSAPHQLAS